jgi:hypothetical protein
MFKTFKLFNRFAELVLSKVERFKPLNDDARGRTTQISANLI